MRARTCCKTIQKEKELTMLRRYLIIFFCLTSTTFCHAAKRKDPRLLPISKPQLQRLIQKTPLRSPEHLRLISRSGNSGLAQAAYLQYNALWKKSNNAETNFLRGLAAQRYMNFLNDPFKKPANLQAFLKQSNELHAITRSSLAQAVKLQPKSPTANVAYGFFLWQYDSRMADGLALVQNGVSLNPKSAGARATLGSIYANSSGNAYNPKKAEQELQKAIALDPSYAFPHWGLMALAVEMKEYQKAQREMSAFLKLAPDGTAQKPSVKLMQGVINKGLGK